MAPCLCLQSLPLSPLPAAASPGYCSRGQSFSQDTAVVSDHRALTTCGFAAGLLAVAELGRSARGRSRGWRWRAAQLKVRCLALETEVRVQGASAGPKVASVNGPPEVLAGEVKEEELDILQFDAAIYYVEEDEQRLQVDVARLGRMRGSCSVRYHTEDGSAKAGIRYRACSGEVRFGPGEVQKSFHVPIIDSRDWTTTLEFKLFLTDPQGCELGRYLFVSRVKVIDADFFPTNRFADEIRRFGPGQLVESGVSDIELLLEYFKLNYSFDNVAWKSWATLAVDLLGNMYYLLTIYLIKYIADDVLGPTPSNPLLVPDDRKLTLLGVGAIYLIPYGLLFMLDAWKAQLEISEDSRANLQENIFRKFMNYNEDSRSKVFGSEVGLVMVQDVTDIVDSGYMKMFEVAKNLGRVAVSSYFIVGENPDTLGFLGISAVAISGFVILSYRATVDTSERVSDEQASIVELVQESSQKYRLIADYYIRPQMQDMLQTRISGLNNATLPAKQQEVKNAYFPGWISTVLVAGYISIGGDGIVNGSIQIGAFLATINAVKDVGDSFRDIFTALLDVSRAIGPVQKITELLNLPTALRAMKATSEKLRSMTREQRCPDNLARLRVSSGLRFGSDAIPLQLQNVSFRYADSKRRVLEAVNLSVPQGRLVAVVGSLRGGKSTLIKILGQVLMPTQGIFFVPSYLRILHVSDQPMSLAASLWNNFAIGRVYWKDDEAEAARAIRICRRLGLGARILDELHRTKESFLSRVKADREEDWQCRLSNSDRSLISIARALIYNPEVLVMNRPTAPLADSTAERVFELLQEFVHNRGVELPPESASKRRPRTAFVSFVRMTGVRLADVVWSVEDGRVSVPVKELISSRQIE
mmetsp:Transcript_99142/g.280778  ORF Transcript_99142/g.280778 Transcript_99142/m.280778 type:complete len:871 (+) Transcript_99142:61-2673(+)